MFFFVGSDGEKVVYFKEGFLKEIEKVRNKLYGYEGETFLGGRPVFSLLTSHEGAVVRLEYYERDSIGLVHVDNIKAPVGKLPNLIEFLERGFFLPEQTINPIIEKLRKNLSQERPQVGRSTTPA